MSSLAAIHRTRRAHTRSVTNLSGHSVLGTTPGTCHVCGTSSQKAVVISFSSLLQRVWVLCPRCWTKTQEDT